MRYPVVVLALCLTPALALALDAPTTAADWLAYSVASDRYLNGVSDGYLRSANERLQIDRANYCPPLDSTLMDLIIVVRRYLQDFPSLQPHPVSYSLERALMGMYACRVVVTPLPAPKKQRGLLW